MDNSCGASEGQRRSKSTGQKTWQGSDIPTNVKQLSCPISPHPATQRRSPTSTTPTPKANCEGADHDQPHSKSHYYPTAVLSLSSTLTPRRLVRPRNNTRIRRRPTNFTCTLLLDQFGPLQPSAEPSIETADPCPVAQPQGYLTCSHPPSPHDSSATTDTRRRLPSATLSITVTAVPIPPTPLCTRHCFHIWCLYCT